MHKRVAPCSLFVKDIPWRPNNRFAGRERDVAAYAVYHCVRGGGWSRCEIVFATPHLAHPRTLAAFALKLFRKLESAFDFAGVNLNATQKRMKENYDFRVNKRMFKLGDNV